MFGFCTLIIPVFDFMRSREPGDILLSLYSIVTVIYICFSLVLLVLSLFSISLLICYNYIYI